MRRSLLLLMAAAVLVVAAFHLVSAADERPPALPGVPIAEEQHHHLVFENLYVRVYEVEVGPREATLMHQHQFDYTYIVFGDADLTNAVAGKPEARLNLPDTTVSFSRGPFAHIAVNNGNRPFRNITVELLHRQGELQKYYRTVKEALAAGTPDSAGIRQVGVLETDEMRVVAAGVAGGMSWSPAQDGRDRLVIMVDEIHNTSKPREMNSPFPAGMLAWVPAGKNWSVTNTSAREMQLMVLEFKDTPERQSSLPGESLAYGPTSNR